MNAARWTLNHILASLDETEETLFGMIQLKPIEALLYQTTAKRVEWATVPMVE